MDGILLGLLLSAGSLPCRAGEATEIPVRVRQAECVFYCRAPEGAKRAKGVLLLVPPFNGDGRAMLSERWKAFADRSGLVLLAPTFRTTREELAERKGYYYPEQWSGEAVEKALAVVHRREGAPVERILIFGFSAGAHFAHRFAAWKPERVAAFVAGAAAWWDEPVPALSHVPALIFCGEDDPRFDASQAYYLAGQRRDFPWVWRSFKGVGHEVSPAEQRLAEAFLECYLLGARPEGVCYGDLQTYETSSEPETIPEAVRVRLPSRAFAEVWKNAEGEAPTREGP